MTWLVAPGFLEVVLQDVDELLGLRLIHVADLRRESGFLLLGPCGGALVVAHPVPQLGDGDRRRLDDLGVDDARVAASRRELGGRPGSDGKRTGRSRFLGPTMCERCNRFNGKLSWSIKHQLFTCFDCFLARK